MHVLFLSLFCLFLSLFFLFISLFFLNSSLHGCSFTAHTDKTKQEASIGVHGIRWGYVDQFNKSPAGAPKEWLKPLEIPPQKKNLAREVS
jgi:hypothetical protein